MNLCASCLLQLGSQAVQNGDALLFSGRPETETEMGTTTGEESDSNSSSSVIFVSSPQRAKKYNNKLGKWLNLWSVIQYVLYIT